MAPRRLCDELHRAHPQNRKGIGAPPKAKFTTGLDLCKRTDPPEKVRHAAFEICSNERLSIDTLALREGGIAA